jgi:hypothetical protein
MTCPEYENLVKKIHEKIESLEDVICEEGEIPLNQANDELKQELKSLLENN